MNFEVSKMFERVEKFIGKNNLEKIQSKTVAIVGLGGVGGYAAEALVRSGIQKFILIDYDRVDSSNLNRQIIAEQTTINCYKVDAMEKRILSINPSSKVIKLNLKLDINTTKELFSHSFDYLIDACDTIAVKEELIRICLEKGIPIISSMGTGNKLDPTQLEIVDIKKTSYDPIAKKIRKYLQDNHINKKVPVVYSKEQNPKFTGDIPSMIFVPATSGLLCANYIIKDIIK